MGIALFLPFAFGLLTTCSRFRWETIGTETNFFMSEKRMHRLIVYFLEMYDARVRQANGECKIAYQDETYGHEGHCHKKGYVHQSRKSGGVAVFMAFAHC